MKSKIGKITKFALVALAFLCLFLMYRPAASIPRSDAREARTLMNELIAAQYGCSGDVYFVDSGVGGSTGKDWSNATATIDAAVNLATANDSTLILVAAGHNEGGTAADIFDADVAGVKIVGLGSSSLKPTVDFDNAAASCTIGAANVVIENIRFRPSVTDVLSGLIVEDAGDGATIRNCDFGWAETSGTDEFHEAILFSSGAADGLVEGCTFNAETAAAMAAITISTVSGITIQDNTIYGDYSVACISAKIDTGSEDVVIRRNLLFNGILVGDGGINAAAAVRLVDNTGGYIGDNRIVSDVATALLMVVADDCVRMNNFVSDTDGDEFSGSREAETGSVASHVDG